MRRRLAVAAAMAPLFAGAILRLRGLGQPSFWLDEALAWNSASQLLDEPWWSWIIGFAPDHGPFLYATQLAGRWLSAPELSARLMAALFGIATIPLIWIAVRTLGASGVAAFCAASLLAISPFHVYYSREARPYAISMFFAAAMMILLTQRRTIALPIVLLVLALYTSGTSAPLIGAVGAVCVLSGVLFPEGRRYGWTIAAAAAVCFLCTPLLYRGIGGFAAPADVVRVDSRIFESALRAFTVSALQTPGEGRTVAGIVLLAIIGAVVLTIRNRRAALIAIGMTILPPAVSLALMLMFDHWFAVRYLSAGLPGFIALAGIGIAALCGAAFEARSRYFIRLAAALLVVMLIASQTLPAALREPYEKLQWREIASTIWNHAHEGDVVVTAEHWSAISLDFYLRRLPPRVRHVQAPSLEVARSVLNDHDAAWLVSAGHKNDARVSTWMCRYPIVLAAPHESFRLHYAPSTHHLLATRSTRQEQRAVTLATGRNPFVLHMGVEDDAFVGEGWWMAEGKGRDAARWAIGRAASVIVPQETPGDRVIEIEMQPLKHPTLRSQTVRLLLNEAMIGEAVLDLPSGQYEFSAPKNRWREGVNVITLQFGRSNVPAELTGSSDRRSLSALVQTIRVSDHGSPRQESSAPPVRTIRLSADLNQFPAGYIPSHRLETERFNHDAVSRLIARLGFDPATTKEPIEELALSLVWSSACEDDMTFARRAFAVLVQQVPNEGEERALREMLRKRTRVQLVEHLMQKPEFLNKLK